MTTMVLSDKQKRVSLKSTLETIIAQLPAMQNIDVDYSAYADICEVFNRDRNGWKAYEATGHWTYTLNLSFDMAVKKGPRKKKVSKK